MILKEVSAVLIENVYRLFSDPDGLFTFLDLYLYGMIQTAWIAFSVWVVASFIRWKDLELCWACDDGSRCEECPSSVSRLCRSCSFRVMHRWFGKPWFRFKLIYYVIGLLLFVSALYWLVDVFFRVKTFWDTKVDVTFIMHSLPSCVFDYVLLLFATLVYYLSFYRLLKDTLYLRYFIVKVDKLFGRK